MSEDCPSAFDFDLLLEIDYILTFFLSDET